MRIISGILLLISGVIFPLGMVAWLNSRLGRAPQPTPRQVGLLLAFNGLFPVALITLGLGLMLPRLGDTFWLRAAAAAAWIAAGAVLTALLVLGRRQRIGGQDDG